MPLPDPVLLRVCVEPVLDSAGVVLEGLTVSRAGQLAVVVVVIDRAETSGADASGALPAAPMDLDRVAQVSRMVSDAFDSAPASLFPGDYTLEVTTPGIDRPLVLPRHWSGAIGRLVEVRRRGAPTVTGRVLAVAPEFVQLQVPGRKGAPTTTERIELADVTEALVQVEFSRVASPMDGCDE